MTGYFVTALAITGLFLVRKYPATAFAIWTCTNGYWAAANFSGGNIDQAVMFTTFVVACMINWRKSLKK